MTDLFSAFLVFVLLWASAGAGLSIQPHLRAAHRARETIEVVQLITGMLVTFAALVLGLLTASAKDTYDRADRARGEYAMHLSQLDQCLRDYGPETEPARQNLRSYTAAVIASTWPSEPRPTGVTYPDTSHMPRVGPSATLEGLLNDIGVEIDRLNPADPFHTKLTDQCTSDFRSALAARLAVIDDARQAISAPFYWVLVFWLMIVFASLGLSAPRNRFVVILLAIASLSLTSVMFVIFDLSQPYGGVFAISSDTMRGALSQMIEPPPP
jgi:hypothetical protein